MPSKWTDNRTAAPQPGGRDALTRLFGGAPLAALVRLVLLSIVVGFILREAHIDPRDIFLDLEAMASHLWALGLEPLRWLWQYFAVGAVVVVPLWLLVTLTRGLRGR